MPGPARVYVRAPDRRVITISSRPGHFGARLCRTSRVSTIADAKALGLFPRFVEVAALEREASRLRGQPTFDRDAAARVALELDAAIAAGRRGVVATSGYRTARIDAVARELRVGALAATLPSVIGEPSRRLVATRALELLDLRSVDVVHINLASDLDLYTDLELAADITLAEFADVRIFRGARLIARASHFVLRARSLVANVLEPHQQTLDLGASLVELTR